MGREGAVGEQLLQHAHGDATYRVADDVDRMGLVPLRVGARAFVAPKARVPAPPRVLRAVVNHAALERVEDLARSVVVRGERPGSRRQETCALVASTQPGHVPVRVRAEEAWHENDWQASRAELIRNARIAVSNQDLAYRRHAGCASRLRWRS